VLPLTDDPPAEAVTGLRDRKKRAVRDAIVDAALDLFAADGFEATTVLAVADRAGVSPATVARYFPTKESMLFSERDVRSVALAGAIAARPRREGPLRAVIGALADQPPVTPRFRRRLVRSRRAIARSTVLRGRSLGLLDEWRDAIAGAVVARGLAPEDARVLATAVVAVLDDVTARWAAAGGRGDIHAEVGRALTVLEPKRRSA
jgi:AcrR family transcriptional regulator